MVREDLVNSAVAFLRDPGVAGSPLDKRIAFLRSKSLTRQEIDTAFARVGENPPSASPSTARGSYTPGYAPPNQRSEYGGQQASYWQQQPPILPRRDWRDWFIMATMMGGVTYGLYVVAKRYISPLIAPPTAPQLEQDKKAIEESFNRAFALLDQLSTDTEALKASEQARTERLDTALAELQGMIGEAKIATQRRELEASRVNSEVLGLKNLLPRAMESQKESTDRRLTEIKMEMQSLKTLINSRIGPGLIPLTGVAEAASPSLNGNVGGGGPSGQGSGSRLPASDSTAGEQRAGSRSPALTGDFTGPPSIPAWQMAASTKATVSGDNS
ncbi:MAG: peroxisomal membrane protein pex14 [Peltula sp. TS41687]|nr:MAG: peroxisomal membrane protein pex14 [Peltula sp. TS41687]